MPITQPHRITVALRMAGIAGQDKLNGIFNYLSEGHRWQLSIFRTSQEFTAETVQQEIHHGTEGFIVGLPETDSALRALARTNLPTVLINVTGGGIENRKSNLAFVCSDSNAIGSAAARELLKEGTYKCFGYAGFRTDEAWSRERGTAFRNELEKAGFIGRMFDLTHYPDKLDDRTTMIKWLKALVKPCGILASCDDRAFEILNACRAAGIRVPQEIGILGINNDPLLCENTEPRLSSVQPNFIQEGFLAAQLLGKMLNSPAGGRPPQNRVHLVGIRQIVHRDSTRPISSAGLLVQKALAFIEKNALRGIGVKDVTRHLKVSYSLLHLRFQELLQETIYETILRIRLDAVRHQLVHTADSIDSIAERCGWKNPASLKKLFKTRYGVSLRTYRLTHT